MSHPARTAHTARSIARRLAAALSLLVVLSLALSVLAVADGTTSAEAGVPQDEAAFVDLINASRASNGRGALTADPAAAEVARSWSERMAVAGQISHNPNLAAEVSAWVTNQWSRIGENVGVGYGVSSLHDAFMASSGHRANILGDYNRVGVGVVRESSGRIWVTVVFIKGPAISPPPPPAGSSPIGRIDLLQRVPGGVRVAGWSIDPDTAASNDVHVYVGRTGRATRADLGRGDIANAFPGYGSAHGFDVTIAAEAGTYDVCAYGIDAAGGNGNSLLGCHRLSMSGTPIGSLDVVSWSRGTVTIAGWSIDPDVTSAIDAHVYVDGVGVAARAGIDRSDVAAAIPGYGAGHGYSVTMALPAGRHTACAYGIGVGAGGNSLLGCRTFEVSGSPFGRLDIVQRVDGGVRAAGWALDPETDQPIPVHVYAGGAGYNLTGDRPRGDVGAAFPGYGDRHGYDVVMPAGPEPVQVCAYAIGIGVGGNSLIGCRTV